MNIELCCPPVLFIRQRWLVVLAAAASLISVPCEAARWKPVGSTGGATNGMVYMDADSVRQESGFRVALFLTIYGYAVPNAHNIKLDRLTQETAFDCNRREFALIATVGYLQGKKVGGSSEAADWRQTLKVLPQDGFSQRTLDLTCNSPLAPQPEDTAPADAAAVVRLEGPGGAVMGVGVATDSK
jgi:hypothetical protein